MYYILYILIDAPQKLPFIENQNCSKSSHWDGDHNQGHNKQRINHFKSQSGFWTNQSLSEWNRVAG